ncbi:hypothetical protein CC79DRAFT_1355885 [Sarocladium strictum]
MRIQGLILACLAALASAKKKPCTTKACENNPVLSIIQSIQATSFCSSLIGVETRTSTALTTVTQTLSRTATVVVTQTNSQTEFRTTTRREDNTQTAIVDGPTVTVTETVTDVGFVTRPVTETVTATAPPVVSTDYPRNGPVKRLEQAQGDPAPAIPHELEGYPDKSISRACKCLVKKTTTTTTTSTVTATAGATRTVSDIDVISPTLITQVDTVTTTATVTVTQTRPPVTSEVTVKASVTSTTQPVQTATVTVPGGSRVVDGPSFNFVSSLSTHCVPYNYMDLYAAVPDIPLTYDAIFNFCANKCASDTNCVQIWVAVDNPVVRSSMWCLTGGGDSTATWTSGEIQCNYPPIGQFGYWYSKT